MRPIFFFFWSHVHAIPDISRYKEQWYWTLTRLWLCWEPPVHILINFSASTSSAFIMQSHLGTKFYLLQTYRSRLSIKKKTRFWLSHCVVGKAKKFITKQHLNKINNIYICLLDLPSHKLSLGLEIQPSFGLFMF